MKEVSPFTDQLYDHTFDIDVILDAFCGKNNKYLNTQTGHVSGEGIEGTHCFLLEPLPESFVDEIKTHPKRNALAPEGVKALDDFLAAASVRDFPAFFNADFAGGWLRERVKDVALEWLDMNELIPPSMRHVREQPLLRQNEGESVTVKIEL